MPVYNYALILISLFCFLGCARAITKKKKKNVENGHISKMFPPTFILYTVYTSFLHALFNYKKQKAPRTNK